MKAFLIIFCLMAEILLVLALPDTGLEGSEIKKLDDWSIDDMDVSLEEISPDSQRKRDPGYYYNKPNRFPSSNFFPHSRHGHRGRVVTKLQNQVNRPFNQYGPPKHESSLHSHNRPTSANIVINQDVPAPIRQTEFIEESPIASQNNLPFGQHTANYLPPKNQKLPSLTGPHTFSNQNHDFPNQHHHQQQQHQQQINHQHQLHLQQQVQQQQLQLQQEQLHQQQQYNHIQEQNFNQGQQQQQQEIQLQIDNQNSFGQNFRLENFNRPQNEVNNNQQISDAALFLSQNAPAISQLYEAPALNQNYAPYNQEFQQGSSNQLQNQNFQIQSQNQLPQFSNQHLPSYSSGVINTQQTLEHVKSLEKDRLINQLQLELSSRDNAARFVPNNEEFRNTLNEDAVPVVSLFPPKNRPLKLDHAATSLGQPGSSPSNTLGSSGYQGFYPPPVAAPPTQPPVLATPGPPVSTTFQPSHGSSESGSTEVGTSFPAPGNLRPPTTSVYPQYGGFVPTLVSATNFVPSIPTYGKSAFPTTVVKPTDNSPTHFGIPIPTLQDEKPVHVQPHPAIPTKPTSISLHPGISTVSVPLGPVHHFPSHPQIIKPSLVPVHPAATPVHPTYGVHPAVVNPSFIYKPVKVYPVYYPHLGYSSGRKSVYSTIQTHPWSYAPSYAQAKQIWK